MLGALLAALLVPTACVLWFMITAMRNERWAVRQRLTQTYRGDLLKAKGKLREYWSGKLAALTAEPDAAGPQTFARLVRTAVADSVVIRDASGKLVYPVVEIPRPEWPDPTPAWKEAEDLELQGDPDRRRKAAEAYAKIARQSQDVDRKAFALQAQARCLLQSGRTSEALAVLTGPLSQPALRDARDPRGRLIVPNAMLLVLQLMGDPGQPTFRKVAEDLARRLNDYAHLAMLSRQRRFLMRALVEIAPEAGPFPTSAAEDLAAEYLAERGTSPEAGRLTQTGLRGVWHFAGPDEGIVAVFPQQKLIADLSSAAGLNDPPAWTTLRLAPPEPSLDAEAAQEAFLSMPAAKQMPDWELRLHLAGDNPFTAAADRQRTAYLWTGTLGIVVIVLLALIVARHLGRQMKLARLKNDLVATVSHELKTPLSSIRLLVDTLLDAHEFNEPTVREYLQLVAKENTRLSRLIDNFLAFSRMERNKHAFEFADVRPADVIDAAAEVVHERFASPGCRFEVDVAPDLPAVLADADALVTAVLNLLDNAYKYSGDDKHIVLRAYAEDGRVCFEVADNGVGLSPRASKKIFKRFYQVDQRVSRSSSGVGLGLSIVQFIVAAHGGAVGVRSQAGRGSTFTVTLPAAPAGAPTAEGASA